MSYDELSDKCSEDLGVRTATVLSGNLDVTIVMHKKKNYEKKHIDLEPVFNLLNPFVELLLQLLVYIPNDKDTSPHAQEVCGALGAVYGEGHCACDFIWGAEEVRVCVRVCVCVCVCVWVCGCRSGSGFGFWFVCGYGYGVCLWVSWMWVWVWVWG